jgi:hypothetical protein
LELGPKVFEIKKKHSKIRMACLEIWKPRFKLALGELVKFFWNVKNSIGSSFGNEESYNIRNNKIYL